MPWALIAAAAAGLNAGSGIQAAYLDSVPASATDPSIVNAFWTVSKATAAPKTTLSNTLSAISSAACVGAYLSGGDNADPAWITCAFVTGVPVVYNMLVVSPVASVLDTSPSLDPASSPHERQSWLASLGRRSWVSAGLGLAAFACTLLVLGSDGFSEGTSSPTSNPLGRFTR